MIFGLGLGDLGFGSRSLFHNHGGCIVLIGKWEVKCDISAFIVCLANSHC